MSTFINNQTTFTTELLDLEYDDFEKFTALAEGDRAVVIKVYDGDTLTVGFLHGSSRKPVRESVRIRGIDTPELRTKSEEEKRLALLARSRLEEVALREVVTVVSPESDKYGRILCDLKIERGIASISEYMLQEPGICRKYDGGKRQPWP